MELLTSEILTTLPLFQGIGKNELAQFSNEVPHTIVKYNKGQNIVSQESPCRQLILILQGTIGISTDADNRIYTLHERLHSPIAIQPEMLYGISLRYTHTYTAQSEVKALVIPKEGVATMFSHFEVFRLNIINMLSTKIYRQQQWFWHNHDAGTEKRIVHFIHSHCSYPAGEKVLEISMEQLGRQINEPRMKISRTLNQMQKKGWLLLHRGKIIVPALEKLILNVK